MAATPTAREWDSQSLHTGSAARQQLALHCRLRECFLFLPPVGGRGGVASVGAGDGGNGGSPGATIEVRVFVSRSALSELYAERACWVRLDIRCPTSNLANAIFPIPRARRTHWSHTVVVTRTELDHVFNNTVMKKGCVIPRSFVPSRQSR